MSDSVKTSVVLLRLGIGWLMFYAGWSKAITFFTDAKDWTAAGFLNNLEGPFADLFSGLAGNALVDNLVAYGLLLIGTALLLGILVRWAAFWGILLMIVFYLAEFPPEYAYVIDDHIIYVLVLVLLAAIGAGRIWGLDGLIEKSESAKSSPWLTKILG